MADDRDSHFLHIANTTIHKKRREKWYERKFGPEKYRTKKVTK